MPDVKLANRDPRVGQRYETEDNEFGLRNMDHFAIRVVGFDAAALKAHLERNGVDPGEVRERYGAEGYGPSLYICDPDGNTVELKGEANRGL